MGETSFYYPSSVYCRQRLAAGDFGRVFYSRATTSTTWISGSTRRTSTAVARTGRRRLLPAHALPTHAVGNVLSGDRSARHARLLYRRSGRPWRRGCSTRRSASSTNDFSNATALFKLAGRQHHADQRDAPGRVPVAHPGVAAARVRHRGQLRAARDDDAVADQGGASRTSRR